MIAPGDVRPFAILTILLLTPVSHGSEQTQWQKEKCALFTEAWERARSGVDDISEPFSTGAEAFIASGCADDSAICPSSSGDRQVADLITMLAMNAGAASTFLPFRCPPRS